MSACERAVTVKTPHSNKQININLIIRIILSELKTKDQLLLTIQNLKFNSGAVLIYLYMPDLLNREISMRPHLKKKA